MRDQERAEAERSLLVSLFSGPKAYPPIAHRIHEELFLSAKHRHIINAVQDLYEGGGEFNALTVRDWLSERGLVERVGGLGYLDELHDSLEWASSAPQHLEYLEGQYAADRVRRIMDSTAKKLGEQNGVEVLDGLSQDVVELELSLSRASGPKSFRDALTEEMAVIAEKEKSGGVSGMPTGFLDFDDITGGLHRRELVVVGGYTSRGKSIWMEQAAYAVAAAGHPVLIMSLEMSVGSIACRALARESGVDNWRIRTGRLGDERYAVEQAKARLEKLPVHIDDTGGMSVSELLAKVRSSVHKYRAEMVCIDFLQLVATGGDVGKMAQQVGLMAKRLQGAAKNMDVAMLLVSQLRRPTGDHKEEPVPSLFQLKESGDVENAADVVVLVHRPQFGNREEGEKYERAQFIIAKNRHGTVGTHIPMLFDDRRVRFLGQVEAITGVAHAAPAPENELDDIPF